MESAVTIAVSPTSMSGTLRSRAWVCRHMRDRWVQVQWPHPANPAIATSPHPSIPPQPHPGLPRPHPTPTWMTSQSPRVNTTSGSSCTRVPFSSDVCSCTVTTWPLAGRLEPGGPGTSVFFLNSPFPDQDQGQAACHQCLRYVPAPRTPSLPPPHQLHPSCG